MRIASAAAALVKAIGFVAVLLVKTIGFVARKCGGGQR